MIMLTIVGLAILYLVLGVAAIIAGLYFNLLLDNVPYWQRVLALWLPVACMLWLITRKP